MQIRTIALPWTTITVNTTTDTFFPSSGWSPAAGFDEARGTWESIAKIGNIEIAPAYQVANTTDDSSPSSFPVATPVGTTGVNWPSGAWHNAKPNTEDMQLVRTGWIARLTQAGEGTIRVGGSIDVKTL